jgi:alkyl hydroperoxide reductase subunit AhpF
MRTLVLMTALAVAAGLFAQPKATQPANTKDIMVKMVIPASDALFAAPEKPSAKQWTDLRKQGQILIDAAALLQAPGMIANAKAGSANPAAWNKASVAMGAAGKAAIAAVDKKDAEKLSIDVGGEILESCSSCHDQYMIK